MAYIPPHKRHLTDASTPSPTPDSLVPQFSKNLNLSSSGSNVDRRKEKRALKERKIVYANHSLSRWCVVGLTDDNQFPAYVGLEPTSLGSIERKTGEKPLTLVDSRRGKENSDAGGNISKSPWVYVAENVQQDLLSYFENVRNEMEANNVEEVKPSLTAKFGKILFHGDPSVGTESVRKNLVTEVKLRQLKRQFYTNVPSSYVKNIIDGVVPKIGVNFEEEKELYHIKLSDITRPDSSISCKCSVTQDEKKLKLYKIELNQVRHLVIDISCLDKNLDLRLMLSTKGILTSLTDDEKQSISNLISSAILDPDLKGGLRWPFGKESSGDRYSVIGVWHIKAKAYTNSSVRLRVRDADRFDFRTSAGEVAREITLKMTGLVSQLREQKVEVESVSDQLKDTLKLVWDHFLSSACSFT